MKNILSDSLTGICSLFLCCKVSSFVFLQRVRYPISPARCMSGRCPTASSCPGLRPLAPASLSEVTSSAMAWGVPMPRRSGWTASRDTTQSKTWVRNMVVDMKQKYCESWVLVHISKFAAALACILGILRT